MKRIICLIIGLLVSMNAYSLIDKQETGFIRNIKEINDETSFKDVWVYTKGTLRGELHIEYMTPWLCFIFKLGVFKKIFVEYGADGIILVWNKTGLIYEYTGKYTLDAEIFKGYYNPRIFHHPFRRGHCIGFGFCKELAVMPS